MISSAVTLCLNNGWQRSKPDSCTHEMRNSLVNYVEVPADRYSEFLQAVAEDEGKLFVCEISDKFCMFFDMNLTAPTKEVLNELEAVVRRTASAFYSIEPEVVRACAQGKTRFIICNLIVDTPKALAMYEYAICEANSSLSSETTLFCTMSSGNHQVFDSEWRVVVDQDVYVGGRPMLGSAITKKCTGAEGRKRCDRACLRCQTHKFYMVAPPLVCESNKSFLQQLQQVQRPFDDITPNYAAPNGAPHVSLQITARGAPQLVKIKKTRKWSDKKVVPSAISMLLLPCIKRFAPVYGNLMYASRRVGKDIVPEVYKIGNAVVAYVSGPGSSYCHGCEYNGKIFFNITAAGIRQKCSSCKYISVEAKEIGRNVRAALGLRAPHEPKGALQRVEEDLIPMLDMMRKGVFPPNFKV